MTVDEQSPSVSPVLYGLLCGIALVFWLLIEYALGFHTNSFEIGAYSGYFSLVIPAVFLFTALHDYQKKYNRTITFIEGINIGFKIVLISSIIIALFYYIYNRYINPEWINLMIESERKNLILNGASNDQIGRFMEQNKSVNTPFARSIMELLSATTIGILWTIIEIPLIKQLFPHKK